MSLGRLRRAASPDPSRARLHSGGMDASSSNRTLAEVTLVRAVSILEAFVIDLGEEILLTRLASAEQVPGLKPLTDYLFKARWEKVSGQGGWHQIVEIWDGGLAVNPKTFSRWDEIDVLRTARHAVVHKLGEFTREYRKKEIVKKRLKALGIDPSDATGLIPLDRQDVEAGIALCREFVQWLDNQLAPS